jgi:hypothetical protein
MIKHGVGPGQASFFARITAIVGFENRQARRCRGVALRRINLVPVVDKRR